MFIYICFFFFLSYLALRNKQYLNLRNSLIVFTFISIFVGFRYFIGPDFETYLSYSQNMIGSDFISSLGLEVFERGLLWFSSNFGFSLYGFNFVIALIFSFGLIYFVSNEKNPWMAILAAYPYLIVAVAMGYPGQSAAIGIELIALDFFEKDKLFQFLLLVSIAVLFHTSALALLFIPLIDVFFKLNRKSSIKLILFLTPIIYVVLNNFSLTLVNYYDFYFGREYNARGILVKILITTTYALFFLLFRKKYGFDIQNNKVINIFSYLSIFSLILYFFTPSTTALYRMSLYLIPLQLKMASNIPSAKIFKIPEVTWKVIIITMKFLTLLIFLLFSTHNQTWIPYRNLLFL